MSIARGLIQESYGVVEAGGLYWKYTTVTTEKLVNANLARVRMIVDVDQAKVQADSYEDRLAAAMKEAKEKKGKKLTKAERDAVEAKVNAESYTESLRLFARQSERTIEQYNQHIKGTVCAAVVEVAKAEDEEPEQITLVMDRKNQSEDQAKVWIDNLPLHHIETIYNAIEDFQSAKEADLRERLARFQKGA